MRGGAGRERGRSSRLGSTLAKRSGASTASVVWLLIGICWNTYFKIIKMKGVDFKNQQKEKYSAEDLEEEKEQVKAQIETI